MHRASVMKHTLPRWASIFERLLTNLIWTTARGQCRPQKYKSRCTTPLPRRLPWGFVYLFPLRTAQRQEDGLTIGTNSRGWGSCLSLPCAAFLFAQGYLEPLGGFVECTRSRRLCAQAAEISRDNKANKNETIRTWPKVRSSSGESFFFFSFPMIQKKVVWMTSPKQLGA